MERKSKLPIAAVMVFISVAYCFYNYSNFKETEEAQLENTNRKLQSDIDKSSSELSRLRDFQTNIERVKQELRELNNQLEFALEHMPRSFNLSFLLKRLTELAQNSGVELSSFKPKKGVEAEGHGAFYSTISIDFEVKGTFVQTLKFLDQMARLKRIINIEALRMRANESGATQVGGALAQTSGTIRTYRFSE